MFPPHYFAVNHYAPRYFAPGLDEVVIQPQRSKDAGGHPGSGRWVRIDRDEIDDRVPQYARTTPSVRVDKLAGLRSDLRQAMADLESDSQAGIVQQAYVLERRLDDVFDQGVLSVEFETLAELDVSVSKTIPALRLYSEQQAALARQVAEEDEELIAIVAAFLTVKNKRKGPIDVKFD